MAWYDNLFVVKYDHAALQRLEEKLDELREVVLAYMRQDARGDRRMARTQDQVLELARQAKTSSESANIGITEAIRILKSERTDPVKNEEAATLLEALIANDAAILKENTPEFGASTNT